MGLFGGILGGIIGSIFAGPWGAAIGAGIGCMVNEGKKPAQSPLLPLFRALAKIAKADGVVSQEEAALVSELIKNFGKDDPDLRKALKAEFDQAKASDISFADEAKLLAQLPVDARREVLEIFCTLARIDNYVDEREKQLLYQAEKIFRLPGFVDQFFNGSRQQTHAPEPGGDDLAGHYRTLGISPSATDEEVKKAWKKKSLEFHPDRLAGKGLSEAFIELAEAEMKKINLAYDAIMKSRKK